MVMSFKLIGMNAYTSLIKITNKKKKIFYFQVLFYPLEDLLIGELYNSVNIWYIPAKTCCESLQTEYEQSHKTFGVCKHNILLEFLA